MPDLTAARLRRANPSIDKETARQDAAMLHDIIDHVRKAYAVQPLGWYGGLDDTIESMLRSVVIIRPRDYDAACREGEWLASQLWHAGEITGRDDLHRDFLRVCGHVIGFDIVAYCGLDDDDDLPPSEANDANDAIFEKLMAVKIPSSRRVCALRVVHPSSGDDDTDAVFEELMARKIDI